VLRGHCPAFGDSVTLWPMVEIVRQAAGIAPDDSAEQARARLGELLGGEERGTLLTERIAQLVGLGQDTGLPEDTFWALQRLLETLARRQPLVLVVDDLQWGDPILLDGLEHVAEYADAPLVVLCMARPDELFARRAHWPGGKANALSLTLSPLPEREGEQLVVHLLGGRVDQAVQAHISEWAQGFPLLVEELVSSLREEGRLRAADGRWTLAVEAGEAAERRGREVPTSIHALLLARLDRLGARGRVLIEPAAVVGQQFHLGDIEALNPGASSGELAAGLQELVRLDLIRPDHGPTSAPLPPNSGPGYRFRHATIKTVAYERLPDDRRAELHERYADWLEQQTDDRRSQFDEIVGHHFYEAYRYTTRLDPGSDRAAELARRAGERYAAAGQRAAVRGDTRLVQAWLGGRAGCCRPTTRCGWPLCPRWPRPSRPAASSPRPPGPTRSWPGRRRRSATRAWPCTPPSAASASPPSTTRGSSCARAATRSSWPSPPSTASATASGWPRPGTCWPTWTGPGAGSPRPRPRPSGPGCWPGRPRTPAGRPTPSACTA
jgi:predicted ATPase